MKKESPSWIFKDTSWIKPVTGLRLLGSALLQQEVRGSVRLNQVFFLPLGWNWYEAAVPEGTAALCHYWKVIFHVRGKSTEFPLSTGIFSVQSLLIYSSEGAASPFLCR